LPLGLFNVTKSGGVHVPVWASNTAHANLGIKFATRYTYSMLGLSASFGADYHRFGPIVALGVRVPTLRRLAVDFDVSGSYLLGAQLCCYDTRRQERVAHDRDRSYYRLRAIPNYRFDRNFSVFL